MIGEHIHGYEITAHLGQGGMGNVFRATDKMLGREVALKMLHPQLTKQPQFLERFQKEARVLARLLHPNIAVIYNLIESNDDHFMVMEYVEGTNLDELLKKLRRIPVQLLVPVFIQALEGLQHAHKKNIFHRDIKPSNLMLTPDGTLKLMDFGIAKVAGEQKMTQVNKIVGTVEFMAPELIEGKPASVASDIYAMGVALYELASGTLPFVADTDYNLMQAILKNRVRPPEKLNHSIPKPLSDIILKAIEKNPANRYPSARTFQQALLSAFPQYHEIDMNVLEMLEQPADPLTREISGPAVTRQMGVSSMETRIETQAKPVSGLKQVQQKYLSGRNFSFLGLQQLQQKYLSGRNFPLIAAGFCLIVAAAIIFVLAFHKNQVGVESGAIKIQKDSPSYAGKDIHHPADTSVQTVRTAETLQPSPDLHPQESASELQAGNEPVKTKKKTALKKENALPKATELQESKPAVKVEDAPVVKPVEKKEIYIDSKIEVNLFMREDLGQADGEKERTLTFTVSSPVVYNGVVIIKQGASARGSIKIGRVMTSINIDYVTGANGQELALKSVRIHRRRSELSSDRNYTAILVQGTRMSF